MTSNNKKGSREAKQANPRIVNIEEKRKYMVATNSEVAVVPLMSAREISTYLGVSKSTIWRYVKSGQIPTVRLGGLCKFDVLAVRAALDRTS